jgi:hypothetical protein
MGKMVRAGAGIFDKQEAEPHKNGPAPQHWIKVPQSNKGSFFTEQIFYFWLTFIPIFIITQTPSAG